MYNDLVGFPLRLIPIVLLIDSDSNEIALNTAGTYTFNATVGDKANDGIRLFIDGQPVIDRWNTIRQAVLADTPADYWRLGDAVRRRSSSWDSGDDYLARSPPKKK